MALATAGRSIADRLRRSVSRRSLLLKFGLVGLIAMVFIGLVLGQMLRASVERQALTAAVAQAEVISRLGLQNEINPSDLKQGLSPDRIWAIQLAVRADFARIDVVDVVLWDLDRNIIFATDTDSIGQASASTPELEQAANGEPLARITDVASDPEANALLRRHGTVVDVYQPLRFGSLDSSETSGVLRTSVPHGPMAETIARETNRLYLALAGALFLLYTLLFRLVANASFELRRRVDENEHQARHDALTGLPNRTLFTEQVNDRLNRASPSSLAVVVIDLDRFKEVNDTLGHHHGDLLLVEIGRRLRHAVRPTDTVARLGGDEFALLLNNIDVDSAIKVTDKIVTVIEAPFDIEGLRLDVGGSLGIAMAPDHGSDIVTLLQRADIAMYEAKRTGSGSVLYDPKNDHTNRQQLALAGELRRAIKNDLVVYYQPKMDLASDRPSGMEALVRWQHPEHGLIPPDEFIPLAERSGLMKDLTRVVLEQSLAQLRVWNDAGFDLHMAVNVSARGLHDAQLADMVGRILTQNEVPSERLVLEITETTIAADPDGARQVLQLLRSRGVRISIDDFGTGYSSLAVLRSLPVNELKIDRQFVSDLDHPEGSAIVEYSVQLGHMLGLKVVAEGVEQAADAAKLHALGCDIAQGYWYARPMQADDMTPWLADRQQSQAQVGELLPGSVA